MAVFSAYIMLVLWIVRFFSDEHFARITLQTLFCTERFFAISLSNEALDDL